MSVAASLEETSGGSRPLPTGDAPGGPEKVWTHGRRTAIYPSIAPELEGVSGKYFVREKEKPSVPIFYEEVLQERTCGISEELTSVRHPVPCVEDAVYQARDNSVVAHGSTPQRKEKQRDASGTIRRMKAENTRNIRRTFTEARRIYNQPR